MAPTAKDINNTCKYVYKNCMNPRSTKKNGARHSLCEFHRRRANLVQMTYVQKKKRLQAIEPLPHPSTTPTQEPCTMALLDGGDSDHWLTAVDWQDLYETLRQQERHPSVPTAQSIEECGWMSLWHY
ncbi:Aste57867_23521 [Aphanomyces stellatus]|uniref:Aste57867_23521 protein n=1 Tax=Aphanomyces stellatus TaxID=120398 RepID=A0A485LPK3_9STRA|nr:hypothetical protein As57867_023450 [Aphanomyces stellatus]VFU00166.1 Aste57867_23521 [Aphanomyces stellatus]